MPDISPVTIVGVGIVGAVILLVLLATFSLLRSFLRGMRYGRLEESPAAMDPNPPAAVEPTVGLRSLAGVALTWGLFNILMMIVWLWKGSQLLDPAVQWLLGTYVLVSAGAVVVGATMLLAGRRYGRRGVAWGCMLMGVMSFCGSVMFVVLRSDEEARPDFREVAVPMAIYLAIHVVVDVLLGTLAQRVGLSAAEEEDEGPLVVPDVSKAPYDQ